MKNIKSRLAIIKIFLFVSILTITSFSYAALDPSSNVSVTFSPQSELYVYLSELRSIIDNSNETLEIALYSLEDGQLKTLSVSSLEI